MSGRAAKASLATPLKAVPALPVRPSASRASVCVADLERRLAVAL
jgi:hypothetical protein